MKLEKKVSIIMGIYNCEETIAETIQTILKQTYENWELIMCDDGSSDNTYEIAYEYTRVDRRMKLLKSKQNVGLAKVLNICLAQCTGDYIMRHDGDDLMVEKRIEKQVHHMDNNDCDACGSEAYLFDESGIWGIRKVELIPSKHTMIVDSPFIHPTVIMKHASLLAVGGYSDNHMTKQRLEDYDLWLKLYEKGFILHNIQEPLIYYREDKNSYCRKSRKFRMTETKARLEACKRLKISYIKRILALKPLIVMFIPKRMLRKYHIRKFRRKDLVFEKEICS